MPWNDDFGFNVPRGWDDKEAGLYEKFVDRADIAPDDERLKGLFHEAQFEGHAGPSYFAIKDELDQYLKDEYDIDFDDVFDWDNYEDWYDANSS